MSGRQRNVGNVPRALDAQRARRGSQAAASGLLAGQGLTVNRAHQLCWDPGEALGFDDRGRGTVFVGGDLSILPGSRSRIVFTPLQSTKRKIVMDAVPNLAEVEATPAELSALDTRTTVFLQNHEIRIQALEIEVKLRAFGVVTLNGTVPVTVSTAAFLADQGLCSVSLTPYGVGSGAPGVPMVEEGTEVDGKFYVLSDSATDNRKVYWQVFS